VDGYFKILNCPIWLKNLWLELYLNINGEPGPGAIPRGGQKPGVVSSEGQNEGGAPNYASGGSIATEAAKTAYMHPVPRIGLSQNGRSNNGGMSVGRSGVKME
jgi:hypothetical protein